MPLTPEQIQQIEASYSKPLGMTPERVAEIDAQYKNKKNIKLPSKTSQPSEIRKAGVFTRGVLQGATAIPDMPLNLGKEILTRQTGIPIDTMNQAIEYGTREYIGNNKVGRLYGNLLTKGLSGSIVGALDEATKNEAQPQTQLEGYISTLGNFIGGGAKPNLSTVGSAIGSQAAADLGGGVGAQIAGGILGGGGASGLTKAQSRIAKGLAGTTPNTTSALSTTELPKDVMELGEKAFERTKGAQPQATMLQKSLEGESFTNMKPETQQSTLLKMKSGASNIEKILEKQRFEASNPFYEEAFKNEVGRYVRPAASQPVNKLMLSLEDVPDFQALKSLSLKDSRNIENLDKGFEGSLAMYNDIKSKAVKFARKQSDPQKEASFYNIAETIDDVIQTGTPEARRLALTEATTKYRDFSRKIDGIFGEKSKGLTGKLLKYEDYDAQAPEAIDKQVQAIFESGVNKVKEVKNVYNEFGQAAKFGKAFAGYTKSMLDNTPRNVTLYSQLSETPKKLKTFEAAIPEQYKGKVLPILKSGENLQKMIDEAIMNPKENARQLTYDLVKTAGGQQQAFAAANVFQRTYNKLTGKNEIDKQIIDILFDPKESQKFLQEYSKQKTAYDQNNFVMRYIMKYTINKLPEKAIPVTVGATVDSPRNINGATNDQQ